MTHENIPQAMADAMIGTGVGVIGFLLIANILLLAAGNFMEPSSIVLILAPILFPIAMKLGIDPVHFGIIMVVNMEVGMCHPPVGLNLYVASGITKMGITELTYCGATWPWLLTMLVFLVGVTYWPPLSGRGGCRGLIFFAAGMSPSAGRCSAGSPATCCWATRW
jgi:C4-dicarboxylate transporter DctM subunit